MAKKFIPASTHEWMFPISLILKYYLLYYYILIYIYELNIQDSQRKHKRYKTKVNSKIL